MPQWLKRAPALLRVDLILHKSEKFTKLICCGNHYSVFVLINFYEKIYNCEIYTWFKVILYYGWFTMDREED